MGCEPVLSQPCLPWSIASVVSVPNSCESEECLRPRGILCEKGTKRCVTPSAKPPVKDLELVPMRSQNYSSLSRGVESAEISIRPPQDHRSIQGQTEASSLTHKKLDDQLKLSLKYLSNDVKIPKFA